MYTKTNIKKVDDFLSSLTNSAVLSEQFVNKIIAYILTVTQQKASWSKKKFKKFKKEIEKDLSRTGLITEKFKEKILNILEYTYEYKSKTTSNEKAH